MQLNFHEITDIRDPVLLPWLDLLETAFPPSERPLMSSQLEDLILGATNPLRKKHRLAALDQDGNLLAIARFTYLGEIPMVYLIHLAVAPEHRSKGIGARVFEEVCARVALAYPEVPLIGWELERPEVIEDSGLRRAAERRIVFYERLGAKRLHGVNHIIHNRPELPRVPMYVMLQSVGATKLADMEPMQVLTAIAPHFGFELDGTPVRIG